MSNPSRARLLCHATALLAAIAIGGPTAVAQTPRTPETPESVTTEKMFVKMSAIEAEVLAFAKELEALTDQMKSVLAEEPEPPHGADADAQAAWQRSHDAWKNKVAMLAGKIRDGQAKLLEAERKLEALLRQDLPAAMAKDRAYALRQLEARAKTLAAALQEATTELDRASRAWSTRPVRGSVLLPEYTRAGTVVGKLTKAAATGLPPG